MTLYKNKFKTIIIEVGMNDGREFINRAKNEKDLLLIGFEPTPKLAAELREKTKGMDNVMVIEKAVSKTSGKSVFHIAGQADWGCSSLKEFSENLDKTWPGRTDFKVTESVNVDVISLKDFIEEHKIPKIDYLHIDAQGSDLDVLEGLHHYASIVNAGVVEVAANSKVALYKNQHTLDDVKKFLTLHKFRIFEINSNDCFKNEFNVFFDRN